MTTKIAYFAHDLNDPAIHRRVRMLKLGGAELSLLGFRRGDEPTPSVEGVPALNLARASDGKLLSRAISTLAATCRPGRLARSVQGAHVILARNLEMLLPASRARNLYAPGAALVYECLDIHKLLFSRRLPGRALRGLEASLWRKTDLLLTSSPAYIREYFEPRGFPAPMRLVENKVLLAESFRTTRLQAPARSPGPPWRIGWFGNIRCLRTFDILSALARTANGAVEIIIRGRPTPAVFPDLQSRTAGAPHVHFLGPYRNPCDLPAIYGEVHFAWAIDYFDVGMNANWALGNRIYEASLYGATPVALASVEMGRWLACHGAGVLLNDPPERQLAEFFRGLDAEGYLRLAERVGRIPRQALADTPGDCRELVGALRRCRVP